MSDNHFQIFISSPGDVGQERVIAERVIERLRGEFGGRADLEPVLWEHEPLRATEHFQEQITPPAETDIAVFILWSRLGTPLPEDKFQKDTGEQYQSGTEWEFENAVEAYRETGTPDLLTYRKTKDPETTLSDEEKLQQRIEQKKALESFVDRWFMGEEGTLKAAFHTFETPDEFERRLEEHLRQLIEERLPERQTEGNAREARWHQGSPFRGLQAFEYDHAPVFFGRTKAVGEITSALEQKESEGHPFVLVLGPSGSGKSSVAKAGVAPTITQPGVIEGIGLWWRALFRPSDAPEGPVSGLAEALLGEEAVPQVEGYGFDANELAGLLRDAPSRAANPIERALQEEAEAVSEEEGLPEPPEARLLLIVDQMEELFTLDEVGVEERETFALALKAIVESGPVWCVGTMRSDFYPQAAELEPLKDLKRGAGQYDLPTPSFGEIGQMIRHPAQAAGLRFEKDPDRGERLDEVLHEAATQNPEALPLLEFTLEELYQRRDGDVLTFEAYNELGGLEGALAERAEEVYQDLPADARAALPDVMESLVTIRDEEDGSAEGAAASRRVPIDDVAADDARETLVDRFVEARLLVTDRNDAGEAVVSVAHEALLREWPRLADWIERNRAFLQTRARVQERAARWDEEGRPEDLLLPTGQPLAEARGLVEERSEALEDTPQAYIERSIERAERRERRRRRIVGGAVAAFVLVVAGFGLFSYQQWTAAEEQRSDALRSRSLDLADEAISQAEKGDAMTGMLLALRALPDDMTDPNRPFVPEARAALYSTLTRNQESVHVDSSFSAGLSVGPKEEYVATVHADTTVWIYSVPNLDRVAILRGHSGTISQVNFHPDKQIIATASEDSTARLWAVPDGQPLHTFSSHDAGVYGAEFGANGAFVMTGTEKAAWIWDTQTGALQDTLSAARLGKPFKRYYSSVYGRSLGGIDGLWAHPERRQVVVHSEDQIRFWNWNSDELVRVGESDGLTIEDVAFGPGNKIATSSVAGPESIMEYVVELWSSETGKLQMRTAPIGVDPDIKFGPDGNHILVEGENHPVVAVSKRTGKVIGGLGKEKQNTGTITFGDQKSLVAGLGGSRGGITVAAYSSLEAGLQGEGKVILGHVGGLTGRFDSPVLKSVGETVLVWHQGGIHAFQQKPIVPTRPFEEKEIDEYDVAPSGNIAAKSGDSLLVYNSESSRFTTTTPCGRAWRRDELEFIPGAHIMLTCDTTTIRVFDTERKSVVSVLNHEGEITSWRLIHDDRLLTRARTDSSLTTHLWRVFKGDKIHNSIHNFGGSGAGLAPALTQDETLYAEYDTTIFYGKGLRGPVSDRKDTVVVRRTSDGSKVASIPITSHPTSIEFVSSGDRLIVVYGSTIQGFDLDGERVYTFEADDSFAHFPLDQADPQRRKVVSVAGDSLRIHGLKRGELIRRLQHPGFPNGATYGGSSITPAGNYIVGASESSGRFIAIWDSTGTHATTLRNVAKNYGGERFLRSRSLISLKNTRRATSGLLYDYAENERHIAYDGNPSLRFSPDGTFFVTKTESDVLKMWPLFESTQALIDTARAHLTRNLTDAQRKQFNITQ